MQVIQKGGSEPGGGKGKDNAIQNLEFERQVIWFPEKDNKKNSGGERAEGLAPVEIVDQVGEDAEQEDEAVVEVGAKQEDEAVDGEASDCDATACTVEVEGWKTAVKPPAEEDSGEQREGRQDNPCDGRHLRMLLNAFRRDAEQVIAERYKDGKRSEGREDAMRGVGEDEGKSASGGEQERGNRHAGCDQCNEGAHAVAHKHEDRCRRIDLEDCQQDDQACDDGGSDVEPQPVDEEKYGDQKEQD